MRDGYGHTRMHDNIVSWALRATRHKNGKTTRNLCFAHELKVKHQILGIAIYYILCVDISVIPVK